jgi:hypothetical protein
MLKTESGLPALDASKYILLNYSIKIKKKQFWNGNKSWHIDMFIFRKKKL